MENIRKNRVHYRYFLIFLINFELYILHIIHT